MQDKLFAFAAQSWWHKIGGSVSFTDFKTHVQAKKPFTAYMDQGSGPGLGRNLMPELPKSET